MEKLQVNRKRKALIYAGLAAVCISIAQAGVCATDSTGETEVCYGVAKAGQNECANSTCIHLCSGLAASDRDATEWMLVPKGTCLQQGGKVQPVPLSCQIPTGKPNGVATADIAAGTALYQHGDAARGIPACAACHGQDGNAPVPDYPKLAGQHAAYLDTQLRAFRNQSRANPVMNTAAAPLSEGDIANIAAYLSTQKSENASKAVSVAAVAGKPFRDCPTCPEMMPISPGHFVMGSPEGEAGRFGNETQHVVSIAKSFAIGRYDVTFDEWDA